MSDIKDFVIAERIKDHIRISGKIEGEPRGGSLMDEGSVKRALQGHEPFKNHIINEPARKYCDITVIDYDGKARYSVDIKTTLGGTDNCYSKGGTLHALTDLSDAEIPKAMNFKKMLNLIKEHGKPVENRDYYFLCIDKKDPSNVMVRGAKQLNCWSETPTPSNVLQVNWKKEKMLPPVERTWDEAYDVLVGGAKRATLKFIRNLPREWLDELMDELTEKVEDEQVDVDTV